MKVLIRGLGKGKKPRAHIWINGDTLCRMFSTGGMRPDKYRLVDRTDDMVICSMCAVKEDKIWKFLEEGNYDDF